MEMDSPRTASEIGERSLLIGYILASFDPAGLEARDRSSMIDAFRSALLASDKELLFRGHWSHEVQQELFWQCECLHVLLWATGRHADLFPVDRQVDSGLIVSELNVMSRDVSAWLASLARRPASVLDRVDERYDFWLWRTRSVAHVGRKVLPPFVRDAVNHHLATGTLSNEEVRDGDVVAFGRPFYTLSPPQLRGVADIVRERTRAIRWIGRRFDDWWSPNLDS